MEINGKSKGLGDTIAKFTHVTKLDKVADYVAKLAGLEGCGCDERKEYLNELFPYEKSYRDFKIIKDFKLKGEYTKGSVYKVDKNHELYPHVISLVEHKMIEEL